MQITLILLCAFLATISCELQSENELDLYPAMEPSQGRSEENDEPAGNFLSNTAIRVLSGIVLDFLETQGLTVSRISSLINLFNAENLNYIVDVSQRAAKLGIQAGTLFLKYFPRQNPVDSFLGFLDNLRSRFAIYNIVDNEVRNGPYLPDRITKIVDYVTHRNTLSTPSKGTEAPELNDTFANLPKFDQPEKFNEHNASVHVHDSLKFFDDSRTEGSKYESVAKIPLQPLPVYAIRNKIDSYGVPVKI